MRRILSFFAACVLIGGCASPQKTPPGTEPAQAGIPFSPASLGRSRAGGSALIP